MMSFFEYLVIGGGINGTWTAAELAKRGHSVALLEKFPLPHTRGSSHGHSRIIRKAYPEPFFNAMMGPAYQRWHELEKECGENLIINFKLLVYGDGQGDCLPGVIQTFQDPKNKDKGQLLDNAQLKTKYPMARFKEGHFGLLDEEAGSMRADKALKASRDHAVRHGVQVIDNFSVDDIASKSGLIHVKGIKGDGSMRREYVGRGCVICPGPWANELLAKLNFTLPLTALRVPVYYFKFTNFLPNVFMYDTADDYFYGIPEHEYPGLVKIGRHDGVPVESPNARDQVDCSEIRAKVMNFVKESFPGVEPIPALEECCMYTVTPDWIPILTKHPIHSNIVIGCGFSGTGFKLGPITGEILADMVTGKDPKFDLSPFRYDRFGSVPSSKM